LPGEVPGSHQKMNITTAVATLKQHNDKSNLEIVLNLTRDQMETFLLEKGEQPSWKIIIKEAA
jgi:hypothetical protein